MYKNIKNFALEWNDFWHILSNKIKMQNGHCVRRWKTKISICVMSIYKKALEGYMRNQEKCLVIRLEQQFLNVSTSITWKAC